MAYPGLHICSNFTLYYGSTTAYSECHLAFLVKISGGTPYAVYATIPDGEYDDCYELAIAINSASVSAGGPECKINDSGLVEFFCSSPMEFKPYWTVTTTGYNGLKILLGFDRLATEETGYAVSHIASTAPLASFLLASCNEIQPEGRQTSIDQDVAVCGRSYSIPVVNYKTKKYNHKYILNSTTGGGQISMARTSVGRTSRGLISGGLISGRLTSRGLISIIPVGRSGADQKVSEWIKK